jgi:hypothetical protein
MRKLSGRATVVKTYAQNGWVSCIGSDRKAQATECKRGESVLQEEELLRIALAFQNKFEFECVDIPKQIVWVFTKSLQ